MNFRAEEEEKKKCQGGPYITGGEEGGMGRRGMDAPTTHNICYLGVFER